VRPYLEKPYHKNWAGGVAQGEGLELKPQYLKKKKKKKERKKRKGINITLFVLQMKRLRIRKAGDSHLMLYLNEAEPNI
jgi:hypothetical protein